MDKYLLIGISSINANSDLSEREINGNAVLYGKLRFYERGVSSGNSEVCKRATSLKLS